MTLKNILCVCFLVVNKQPIKTESKYVTCHVKRCQEISVYATTYLWNIVYTAKVWEPHDQNNPIKGNVNNFPLELPVGWYRYNISYTNPNQLNLFSSLPINNNRRQIVYVFNPTFEGYLFEPQHLQTENSIKKEAI